MPPIPGGTECFRIFDTCLTVNPELARCRALTYTLDMARPAHPAIQFHRIHFPTLSFRFGIQNGGLLLRDGQNIQPFLWSSLHPGFTHKFWQ